jgi:carbon storage regulator
VTNREAVAGAEDAPEAKKNRRPPTSHLPGIGAHHALRFDIETCPLLTDEVAMLVLTRKVGEEIVIGGDIRLTITAVGDGRIKIGITAPAHVRVDRAEVAERIRQFAQGELVGAE